MKRTILIWKTGLSIINIKPTISLYRSSSFLKHCASPQKQYLIPFSIHRKALKNYFYSLSLQLLFFLSPNFSTLPLILGLYWNCPLIDIKLSISTNLFVCFFSCYLFFIFKEYIWLLLFKLFIKNNMYKYLWVG